MLFCAKGRTGVAFFNRCLRHNAKGLVLSFNFHSAFREGETCCDISTVDCANIEAKV